MILVSKWLIGIFILSFSVSVLFVGMLAFYYVRADFKAAEYESAYQAMRGEVEANLRTQGLGINPAFTCKARLNDN